MAADGSFSADDARWMRRALALARRGFTPPNPMVGCVLVRDGGLVAEGWHAAAGAPHAEAMALARAGARAAGATAYVTLEPCAHTGRTPPCVPALAAAAVRRVVAACIDPDERVAGRGVEMLRAAGVAAEVGLCETEARDLNAAFFHFKAVGMPLVTLKAAVTLDGRIATRTGDSRWITGPAARRHAHRARARSGAVLCGVGTVLADDPLLTARISGVPRQPLRVILDTHLRTPPGSRLARTAAESPVVVYGDAAAHPDEARALRSRGVEVVSVGDPRGGRVRIEAVLRDLAAREIISVLVEGGASVHGAFLDERLAHRVLWYVAPVLMGGASSLGAVAGIGSPGVADATRVAGVRTRKLGPDVVFDGALRYAEGGDRHTGCEPPTRGRT